jgi:L-threonylcarbamoyladenylate synthase
LAQLTSDDAAALERCVSQGGVAVFPSDTVYGLACDADDAAAAARLYELKGRPPAKPAAVMFFVLGPALALFEAAGQRTADAARALLPDALTLLIANPQRRFAPACGPDRDVLGVRVPLLPKALAALEAVRTPLLQTSANLSGGPDPRRVDDVPEAIRTGADLVLDAGELPGLPSTVVDLRNYDDAGEWRIVREGAVPVMRIEPVLERWRVLDR